MDTGFPGLGFASDCLSNAFRDVGGILRGGPGADYPIDTVLRLDSISPAPYFPSSKGIKRKWSWIDGSMGLQLDPSLRLGLGHSSSSSDSKGSSATACTAISSAKETEEESSMDLDLDFTLHLGADKSPSSKKHAGDILKALVPQLKVDLELNLSTGPSESDITSVHQGSKALQHGIDLPMAIGGTHFLDDESTSSHWKDENFSSPFYVSQKMEGKTLFKPIPGKFDPISRKFDSAPVAPDLSASIATTPKSSVTCTSGIVQQQPQRVCISKTCKFTGCVKGARGASGLCIAHGGGRRCQKPGCHKGAEGRTAFCKAHGGGRRCEFLGCTKSAEGRTDFCIAHGGGRRCSHKGCTRAARGKSGLCIRHGGGKRCQMENCTRSAEGLSGLCISHGGGRRCQYPACTKGAQGSTMFCKAHGGGKRCTVEGCSKGAEGSTPFCKGHGGGKRCSFPGCPKSVHGGTSFCVAHGGGKRCAVPECTKSARGRTNFCVRHGGGKRCKFEGCGKSAQGSTDFCKAHGGGKRCSWGQSGSQYGNQADGPCGSFARGKTGLCAMHAALIQDKRVHGAVSLGLLVQDPESRKSDKMKGVLASDASVENGYIACSTATIEGWTGFDIKHAHLPSAVKGSASGPVPEGRVHGGSLMTMHKGPSLPSSSSSNLIGGPSEPMNSCVMPQRWI
ncbi:hypothetical protein Ancab_015373 [Ancistrocladus abbreviatus]